MRFDVITLFPDLFTIPLTQGVTRRAFDEGRVQVRTWPLRDFGEGPHRRVDDRPYGGGPGMVMLYEPLERPDSDPAERVTTAGPFVHSRDRRSHRQRIVDDFRRRRVVAVCPLRRHRPGFFEPYFARELSRDFSVRWRDCRTALLAPSRACGRRARDPIARQTASPRIARWPPLQPARPCRAVRLRCLTFFYQGTTRRSRAGAAIAPWPSLQSGART